MPLQSLRAQIWHLRRGGIPQWRRHRARRNIPRVHRAEAPPSPVLEQTYSPRDWDLPVERAPRRSLRVGLVADTTPDFVRAFFACQYAGLVPVPLPLPTPLGGRDSYVTQIARMMQSAEATAAVSTPGFEEWVEQAGRAAGVRETLHLAQLPDGSAPLRIVTTHGVGYHLELD